MNQAARFSRLNPEQRKSLLIEATLTCLQLYGFPGTSIRKICAQAKVSVGLISHHYAGKDELVAEAYLTITGRVIQILRQAIDEAPTDARSRLSAFFCASFGPDLLDPKLLDAWLAFWGAVKTAAAINNAHDHSYGQYRTLLAQLLMQLADEHRWDNFDAELAAISLSAMLDGLWLEYGLNSSTFNPDQGIHICEAWIDGLMSSGRQRYTSNR